MQVVALGAGEMGRWAAQAVLLDKRVEQVVLADLDGEAAEQVAAGLGSRARPAQVDVRDAAKLRALLESADVVMNTVGPFYRFGVPILRAAIEARCTYLDICDDWEPTLEMLSLDAEARKAGVTAVIGLGASPGLSNLLAVKALRALDRIESIFTVWSLDGAVSEPAPSGVPTRRRGGPSAAMVHGVHQMTGHIRSVEDGREQPRRPLRRFAIDYPGLGRRHVWSIGHPESVTLPRVFPQLRCSTNAMFSAPSTIRLLRALMLLVDLRLASEERVAAWIERIERSRPVTTPLSWVGKGAPSPIQLPPLFALAVGRRNGQPACAAVALTAAPPGGMGAITGIPLALGVSLVADGALDRAGVFAPEAIVEPDALLAKLLPFCEPQVRNPDDLALMTTSWQDTQLADALQRVWAQLPAAEQSVSPGAQENARG
ncbi:MAG: saccharopine dehydrogenase NADP-binding domain-containing protein [Deltaproteobacteria bacterium]|nr:saccharopine dehydrogenase NADP-binding domain-containing protein [Deltaproteobacteria bacterium]